MKGGRSHRPEPPPPPPPPVAAAADEWGDGSWTVDCSCGVTFDDGEEMVSCDECGVWVHTRCARYVHGAHKSFSCHNCRSKGSDAAGADEAEVAQLLAELPTKGPAPGPLGHRPFFRRWAEVPLPDRVHVHEPPGGDPGICRGVLTSSAFSAALWRCAGYVPKTFGFRYREFPCWEEDDGSSKDGGAGQGADALFALSKEKSVEREKAKEREEVVSTSKDFALPCDGLGPILETRSGGKKEKNRVRATTGGHLGGNSSRKTDEAGDGKERSGRKKSTSDAKRKGLFPIVKSDAHEDGKQQVAESAASDAVDVDKKGEIQVQINQGSGDIQGQVEIDKTMVDESFAPRMDLESSEERLARAEKVEPIECVKTETFPGVQARSAVEENEVHLGSVRAEVTTKALHVVELTKDEHHVEGSHSGCLRPSIMISENLEAAATDPRGSQDLPHISLPLNSKGSASFSLKHDTVVVKMEDGQLSTGDTKTCANQFPEKMHEEPDHLPGVQKRSSQLSENLQAVGQVPNMQFGEHKSRNIKGETTYQGSEARTEEISSRTNEPKKNNQGVEDSAGQRSLLDLRHGSVCPEHEKSEAQKQTHVAPECPKSILGVLKASTASSGPIFSRLPELSHSLGSTEISSTGKTAHMIKQEPAKVTLSADGKHDPAKSFIFAEESFQGHSRRSEKSQAKGSSSSAQKSSQANKTYASSTKHRLPGSKEQLPKHGATGDTPARLFSGEVTSSQSRSKAISPSFCHKKEKVYHRALQPTSEAYNNSPPIDLQASDVSALLSDEQLALLLHQQLNSSPRVPRVPRVRQAVSMQMANATGSTIFSKRSSATGGRDQVSVFKKNKKDDATRENSRSSEFNDDTSKLGNVPSVEQKLNDSASTTGSSSVKDHLFRLADSMQPTQQSLAISSIEAATGCSAAGSSGSVRTLARDGSMDYGSVPRNLPRLIEEIFSNNRHITYEGLCDAVRPHWNDLRKPNGERYAYPSYVHAVNDCLRNRSEWAHLIDQAPKTNSTKKRRKLENDTTLAILSENEKPKSKVDRESEERSAESQREDFPKGKRKARKRRRLELPGRRVKDARKRSSQGSSSDDDPATFSDSSSAGNETPFSEESQENKPVAAENGTDMEPGSASSTSSDTD